MRRNLTRREWLTTAGSASLLATAGIAQGDDVADQYRTVIDVADAGADTSGNRSITSVLRRHVGNDTLLRFPEGRYYMDRQLRLTNFRNVGLVGENATLVPANYYDFVGPRYRLFRFGTSSQPGRNLRFEGFNVDQTAENTGIRAINAEVTDGLTVRDVTVEGVHDSGTWGPGLFNVTDPDGSGVVEGFRARGGAVHNDHTPHAGNMWRGATGIHTNGSHRGTLRFEDCELGGFPDNGLYVNSPGDVHVEGGRYANSAGVSVRMGVDEGSVRDATIAVDADPSYDQRQLGLRLDYGDITVDDIDIDLVQGNGNAVRVMGGADDVTIQNSRISVDGPNPNTGIRVNSGAGNTAIRNVGVEMGVNGNALQIPAGGGGVDVDGFTVTGDVRGSPIQETILCRRSGSRFANLDIHQPGRSRRGLLLTGNGITVTDSRIETHNDAISTSGSGIEIRNTYARASSGSSIQIRSGSVNRSGNSTPSGVR